MPKFKLPEEPQTRQDEPLETDGVLGHNRRVSVPINDEILNTLKVGDAVEVKLIGEIEELSNHESPDYNSKNLVLKVSEVSAYSEPDSVANEMMKDDFESGFERGHSERYEGY